MEYRYWEIHYISCEGNTRWTIARSSIELYECDVRDSIQIGGSGDDISEITGIIETSDVNYSIDL